MEDQELSRRQRILAEMQVWLAECRSRRRGQGPHATHQSQIRDPLLHSVRHSGQAFMLTTVATVYLYACSVYIYSCCHISLLQCAAVLISTSVVMWYACSALQCSHQQLLLLLVPAALHIFLPLGELQCLFVVFLNYHFRPVWGLLQLCILVARTCWPILSTADCAQSLVNTCR